jgi:acetyl esterase/lipase
MTGGRAWWLAAVAAQCAGAAAAAPPPTFPTDIRVERDVVFLAPGRTPRADLYHPTTVRPGGGFPAVVIIHGGGFNGGEKDARREITIGATLARAGILGMSIDYAVWHKGTTQRIWPRNLQDAKGAVLWLRRHADRLGIDPRRIGAIGGSAGGTLASLLALTGPEDGLEPPEEVSGADGVSSRVVCAVDLYGPADLLEYHDLKMLAASRAEAPDLYRQASPAWQVDAADSPVLILHGTADTTVPVAQSTAFARALATAGVEHELIVIDGAPHTFGFDYKGHDVATPVLRFLQRHLGGDHTNAAAPGPAAAPPPPRSPAD